MKISFKILHALISFIDTIKYCKPMFMLLFLIANFWGYLGLPIHKGLDEENIIQLVIVDFSVSHKEEQYYVICRKKGGAGDHDIK